MDQGSRSQPAADNSSLDSESCGLTQGIVHESEQGEAQSPGSEQQNGLCEQQNGLCEQQNGLCEQQNGLCEQQNGLCEQQNGLCEQQNGLCEQQVHVLYLDVPASDEPQVLDLSNLLGHEGIQMSESPEPTDEMVCSSHADTAQEVVIGNESGAKISMVTGQPEIAMVTGQPEKQSAHALLGLSSSQLESCHVSVSDILTSHRHSQHVMNQHEQNTSAEALLQLSSDAGTGTYIVDETGTMIPISQMRSSALIEVEDTGMTTIAICQCWCGREFISQDGLDRHKLAHKYQAQGRMTLGLLKCTLCLESFLSNKDLRVHHAEVHPGGMPWECNICHRTFHKKIAMKAHMRVHNTLTRYQCSSCKKIFFYKTALNRHLKMHSCEKPFKCTICGDTYHSLWDLRKHRMNHQPPKLFACDVCTKVFKQKQTLCVHSRIHTGQKPYLCEVCCQSFSLKSTLVQHRRIHTGEKPNVCHICQRAFRQNSTLKAHLRTHTCLKPYLCRYCKLRFAYKDEVTEHEHSHAHNKTWQCEQCGMWFKNQSLLARHSRVHTNERPFQCSVCHKTFVQSGSLQSHMRSHTKEKPYQCRICSKAYYTSGTLLVHIRKFHNVDAKSVREVFPVYSYIEDQKVFTIRNSLLSDMKPIIAHVDHDETSGVATTNLEDLLGKDNAIVEELVETSGEMIVQDSTSFGESIISSLVDEGGPGAESVHATDSSGSEHKDRNKIKVAGKQRRRVRKVTGTNPKKIGNGLGEPAHEQLDEASQSSHAAQDRQEAALGLAELALTGGEGMHPEKPPQTKTRTFFKEEEEDEKDPNVTKIILSKEGGVMNSQDPHQCSVCGRIFGRKSIMIEHMRIHTDEKPYECDFCQASFRQNAQLRSHIRNNHTQVERYQCSFCHNRFLSHSITVRHIHFHHKLKIKFCQNLDPAWTVDHAVWSDDNFELKVSNTHFMKKNQKIKFEDIGCSDSASLVTSSPETDQQLHSVQPAEPLNKYVVKVSLLASGADSVMLSEDSRTLYEHSSSKTTCHLSAPVNSAAGEVHLEVLTLAPPNVSASATRPCNNKQIQVEVSPSASQTQAALASDVTSAAVKEGSRPSGTAAGIKVLMGRDFGNSRLLCGACAMQFRGISSLRYHLRKVHKKSLDQSDVSYVYEDGSTLSNECSVVSSTEVQTSTLSIEHSSQEEAVEASAETGSVKIVVYDDSKKCADEPSEVNMPYGCLMCCRRYSSRMSLEDHLKSHNEEDVESVGLHRCDLCASVMKNTQQVTKHILKFHGVKQIYICSICNREFFQQSSVYRHMKFLHKWEIKIRGEASIPVFVKPAPLSIHAPSTSSSVLKDRMQSLVEQMNRPVTKLTNSTDDGMTYISLDIGDMDNLQIYKSDGHEVIFEVLSSDKTKSGKVIGKDLGSVKAETTAWAAPEKTSSPTTMDSTLTGDNEHITSSSDVSHVSEEVPDTVTTTAASLLSPTTSNTPTDSGPLIVVGSDKSSKVPVSKKIILQSVSTFTNSSKGNHAGTADDICTVIKLKDEGNTAGRRQADAVSIDGVNTTRSRNIPTTSKITLKEDEAVPLKKLAGLPKTQHLKAPIILSVEDIGLVYSGCVSKLGQQNMSDISRLDIGTVDRLDVGTVDRLDVGTVDRLAGEGFHLLSATRTGGSGEGIVTMQVEEMNDMAGDGPKLNFVKGIIDAGSVAGSELTSVSSETKIIHRKRSRGKASRVSCAVPVTSVQSKTKARSSTPHPVSLCEPASLLTQTANSGGSPTLGGMVPHTGNKTLKPCPATSVVGKSVKQTERCLVSHSRSGRLIKRKRFDDELEEVTAGRKGRRH